MWGDQGNFLLRRSALLALASSAPRQRSGKTDPGITRLT